MATKKTYTVNAKAALEFTVEVDATCVEEAEQAAADLVSREYFTLDPDSVDVSTEIMG